MYLCICTIFVYKSGDPQTLKSNYSPQIEVHCHLRLNNGATHCFTILTISIKTLSAHIVPPVISLLRICPANNAHEQNNKCTGLFTAALPVTEGRGNFLNVHPAGTSESNEDCTTGHSAAFRRMKTFFYTTMKQSLRIVGGTDQ